MVEKEKIGKLKPESLYYRKSLMLVFKWKKQDSNESDPISRPNICNLLMIKTCHLPASIIVLKYY